MKNVEILWSCYGLCSIVTRDWYIKNHLGFHLNNFKFCCRFIWVLRLLKMSKINFSHHEKYRISM